MNTGFYAYTLYDNICILISYNIALRLLFPVNKYYTKHGIIIDDNNLPSTH